MTDRPQSVFVTIEQQLLRWARPALVVYWPFLAYSTHGKKIDQAIPNPSLIWFNLDKLLHAGAFAFLALLLIYARITGRTVRANQSVIAGAIVAAIYAALDELTQDWFGRTVSVKDLYADLVGIAAVSLLAWPSSSQSKTSDGLDNAQASEANVSSAPNDDHPTTFVGHTMRVSILTFLSRLLGLVRDAVLAACFGMTALADAFWIGFLVPNLFRRLFGEGALTAAFIPVYTDWRHKDPVIARRLASLCTGLLLVVLSSVTLIGEVVLAALSSGQWSPDTHLALRLMMIMLPYMPMICVAALLGGILQVHGKFGPPAAAPIVLNLVMIGAALWATPGSVTNNGDLRSAITIVAYSVLLAGLVQLIWQAWAVMRCERFTSHVAGAGGAVWSILTTMLPMLLGLAVFQINTLFDSLIAWGLSPKTDGPAMLSLLGWEMPYPVEPGAVTGLQFAQRLYQFPLGVFGIALATAIFPALSRAASAASTSPNDTSPADLSESNSKSSFRTILQHGLRLTVFVGLPASVGLILVGLPLARVIFERHQFTIEDAVRVGTILACYASAVWAYSMTHVLTRAFYALKDPRTPLKVTTAMVGVNLVLNLILVWHLGAAALALSTALCAMIQAVLLLRAIRRYVDAPVDSAVWRGWAKSVLLTVIMAAVLVPMTRFDDYSELSLRGSAIQLFVMVTIGIAIIFGGAKLLKADELGWLVKRRTI